MYPFSPLEGGINVNLNVSSDLKQLYGEKQFGIYCTPPPMTHLIEKSDIFRFLNPIMEPKEPANPIVFCAAVF